MIKALIINLIKGQKVERSKLKDDKLMADTVGIMQESANATKELDESTKQLIQDKDKILGAIESLKQKRDNQDTDQGRRLFEQLIDRANEEYHLLNEQIAQSTYQTSKRPLRLD